MARCEPHPPRPGRRCAAASGPAAVEGVVNGADLEPWEQLPDEGVRAYEAFRAFRDLGAVRSLAAVAELGFTVGSVRRWSTRFRWRDRAKAWDRETHRLEDARRLEAVRHMDDTHLQVGRALISRAVRALPELGELTANQVARFVDIGTRLERATLLGEHLGPAGPRSEEHTSE